MRQRITYIAALALVAFGLSTPVASAGSNERIDVKYGYARFDSEGEKLAAADIYANRRGVRAKLVWYVHGKKKKAQVTDGSAGYESSIKLSIHEGTAVWLQLCYTRGGAD